MSGATGSDAAGSDAQSNTRSSASGAGGEARPAWARAEGLFHELIDLGPDERRARLERLRETEGEESSALVLELLAGHERAGPDFLEPPARGAPLAELAGSRLGEFTLVRRIGSGGMGAVYEALQDRPKRTVALKIVRCAAGTPRDARRLEHEAELMARLSHPNVAQIHAAGTLVDPGGDLAWFAMELVPGARDLLSFAREERLELEARLELFDRVCRAVQHGHQRGIVHRDLKPANLLVDSSGTPKVIDFGVARALGASAAPLSAAGSALVGTLGYVSPEQARGAEPDTRSDVYSLGVVLYELVTGEHPLPLAGRPALEQEPPRRPSAIRAGLPAELETILLTALAKDPEERYAGVSELAMDLRRFRRHEPIVARPPRFSHRMRLFARRHPSLVLAGTAVALVLVAATAVSTGYGLRAARAGESEARALRLAERVARLHQSLFDSARPANALGRQVTVREVLDDAHLAAERELADEPELAVLLGTIGRTYTDLGEFEPAERVLRRALELALESGDPASVAERRSDLAQVLTALGRHAQAEELLRAALAHPAVSHVEREVRGWALDRFAELLRATNRPAEARAALAEAEAICAEFGDHAVGLRARLLQQEARIAYEARDYAQSEAQAREALALYTGLVPDDHPALAAARNGLASTLFDLGRVDEAEELWQQALATFERILDPDHPDLATVIGNLALVYERRRDFPRALEMFERALALRRAALGADHPRVASTLSRFAMLLIGMGDLPRAEQVAREAVETRRRVLRREGSSLEDPGLADDLFTLGLVLRQLERGDEAEEALREVLRIQRGALEPDHPDLAQSATLLGCILLDADRPEEAEPLLREALEIRRAKLPGHWLTANTESVLGGCLLALGRPEEAEPLLVGSLHAIEQALGAEDFRARDARARLAQLQALAGR